MLRKKSLIILCIVVLVFPVVVCAQQPQYTLALQKEYEGLQAEQAALQGMVSGQTLRGSRKNMYLKRQSAFNQAMMTYTQNMQMLNQDIAAYQSAVREVQSAAPPPQETPPKIETLKPPPAQPEASTSLEVLEGKLEKAGINFTSFQSQGEIDKVKTNLERSRAELLAEYKDLQTKAQQDTSDQNLKQVNRKLTDWVEKRHLFNDAAVTFNKVLKQNVQPIRTP
jgi:hypothetical protein